MPRHAEPARTAAAKAPDRAGPAPAAQPALCPGAAAQLAGVRRTLTGGVPLQLKTSGTPGGRDAATDAKPPREAANRTGLPDRLKAGVEALSGLAMDDVRVHHNSAEPAKLGALAYAKGSDIHLGPGQERHLPHEAWHVVQQKQGRVTPTTQLAGGIGVNADAALEREADTLGERARRQEAGPSPLRSARVTGSSVSIQMAGHAGVMIFSAGRLLKRIEQNEAAEFTRVRDQQQDAESPQHLLAVATFPVIHRVFTAAQLNRQEVTGAYGDTATVRKWLARDQPNDRYVEMENLGGEGVRVFDFKIGTSTANRAELIENHGKTPRQAENKVAKTGRYDATSETPRHGLRDSDAFSGGYGVLLKRFLGRFVPTLTAAQDLIRSDVAAGRGVYPVDARAVRDLDNIRQYLEASNTVYIASSLILKFNSNREHRDQDRVVLIDLAHPVTAAIGQDDFDAARAGMLRGVANLRHLLRGEALE